MKKGVSGRTPLLQRRERKRKRNGFFPEWREVNIGFVRDENHSYHIKSDLEEKMPQEICMFAEIPNP